MEEFSIRRNKSCYKVLLDGAKVLVEPVAANENSETQLNIAGSIQLQLALYIQNRKELSPHHACLLHLQFMGFVVQHKENH